MHGMMAASWIWMLVGVLAAVLLCILIVRSLKR